MTGRGGRRAGAARTVRVDLGERSYPIRIGSGTLGAAGAVIARRTGSRHAVVVTVPGVGRRYGATLQKSLSAAGMRVHRITVPDGDGTKSLDQTRRLYDALLRCGADRHSALVALGGGVVGDLTGFAAATYLRGIQFVQVPTTVLAMVDSSVGGKVGVNLPRGKNLVGAFHQPRLVWIDIDTLGSLPKRQRACGLAEAFKKAAIWDAGFFARFERDAERLLDLDPARLIPVIERACRIKAEIVRRDEREGNLRMLLNFGHTLAHAVETLSGYEKVLHGEAVAMGMVAAARRSEALAFSPPGTAARIESLAARFGLPTELPPFPRSAYISALRVDKKMRDSRIQYVVLRSIGRAETVRLTPAEIAPPAPRRRAISGKSRRLQPQRKRGGTQ
jgi:3-dehydroquinate synthase